MDWGNTNVKDRLQVVENRNLLTGLDRVSRGNSVAKIEQDGDFNAKYGSGKTVLAARVHPCSVVVFSEYE